MEKFSYQLFVLVMYIESHLHQNVPGTADILYNFASYGSDKP